MRRKDPFLMSSYLLIWLFTRERLLPFYSLKISKPFIWRAAGAAVGVFPPPTLERRFFFAAFCNVFLNAPYCFTFNYTLELDFFSSFALFGTKEPVIRSAQRRQNQTNKTHPVRKVHTALRLPLLTSVCAFKRVSCGARGRTKCWITLSNIHRSLFSPFK